MKSRNMYSVKLVTATTLCNLIFDYTSLNESCRSYSLTLIPLSSLRCLEESPADLALAEAMRYMLSLSSRRPTIPPALVVCDGLGLGEGEGEGLGLGDGEGSTLCTSGEALGTCVN